MRRIQSIKSEGDVIGSRVRARVKKNKVAPPFRAAEFDLMYDRGISREGELLDLGMEHEVITRRGSYYYYGETQLAQGRENAKDFLRENAGAALEIENLIRKNVGLQPLEFIQEESGLEKTDDTAEEE